jgi:hypothetical protein
MREDEHSAKKPNLKTEYITRADVSLRSLSKEFNVPLGVIGKWSSEEGWDDKRKRFQDKLEEDTLSRIAPKLAKERAKMLSDIDEILKVAIGNLRESVIGEGKELTVTQIDKLAKLNELLRGNATSRDNRVVTLNVHPSKMTLEQIKESKQILNVDYEETE